MADMNGLVQLNKKKKKRMVHAQYLDEITIMLSQCSPTFWASCLIYLSRVKNIFMPLRDVLLIAIE